MDVLTDRDARGAIEEVRYRLEPRAQRAWAMERLDQLFSSGRAPEPQPEGFLSGRLIASTTVGALDALNRRIASLWMPWLGKSFQPASQTGINLLAPSARTPLKVLWPSYEPPLATDERIEAFRFTTRVEPSAIDASLPVLKIDYDSDDNPAFIIRRILDELVQIDEGLYLGRALYRTRDRWHRLLFFSLERSEA
jgi:hypothetical protein